MSAYAKDTKRGRAWFVDFYYLTKFYRFGLGSACTREEATEFHRKCQRLIVCKKCGFEPPEDLREWLDRMLPATRDRFAKMGLCERSPATVQAELAKAQVAAAKAAEKAANQAARTARRLAAAQAREAAKAAKAAAKADAEREAEERRLEAEDRQRRVTIGRMVEQFLAAKKKSTSYSTYYNACERVVEFFKADTLLSDVTRFDVLRFREHLKDAPFKNRSKNRTAGATLSANTQKFALATGRALFRAAMLEGHIDRTPFTGVSLPQGRDASLDRYIDRETIQELVLHSREPLARLIFVLARYGGLRIPSETTSLTWDSFDWDGSTMLIRATKTEHVDATGRLVPLWPEIADQLGAVRRRKPACPRNYLFKLLMDKPSLLAKWKDTAFKRARIQPVQRFFQNCRASCEHDWLHMGYTINIVASWMGHSPEIALKYYTRVRREDATRAAVNAYLNRGWSADSPPLSATEVG